MFTITNEQIEHICSIVVLNVNNSFLNAVNMPFGKLTGNLLLVSINRNNIYVRELTNYCVDQLMQTLTDC